jgi:hypothetical protein
MSGTEYKNTIIIIIVSYKKYKFKDQICQDLYLILVFLETRSYVQGIHLHTLHTPCACTMIIT